MSNKEDFLQSCLVLDTETNSDQYKVAEIIETGFVIRENDDWTIFQELHKPPTREIPAKVESVCYITNEMVADKPPFSESKEIFQSVVDGYSNGFLVAHNHFYDMKVLENHGIIMPNHKWICTWRLAKKIFNDIEDVEETNLPYLRFKLDLDVPITMYCHRAGNDSYITAKLLEVLVMLMEDMGIIDTSKPYGPQVATGAAEPIIYKRMPFGKHRGELMKDVPHSYWKWALQNMDSLKEDSDNYDPDFAASVESCLA